MSISSPTKITNDTILVRFTEPGEKVIKETIMYVELPLSAFEVDKRTVEYSGDSYYRYELKDEVGQDLFPDRKPWDYSVRYELSSRKEQQAEIDELERLREYVKRTVVWDDEK